MFGISETGVWVLFFCWPHPENRRPRKTIDSIDEQIDLIIFDGGYGFNR
jgi:hypothetical protein